MDSLEVTDSSQECNNIRVLELPYNFIHLTTWLVVFKFTLSQKLQDFMLKV